MELNKRVWLFLNMSWEEKIIRTSKQRHFFKNHAHVKKVGHTSEFLLAFTDELEKQIIIKKTVQVGQ